MTDADLFHLGSNGKAVTATLAGIAVEAGALRWDTAAAELLGLGAATLAELLRHSAGLRPYTEDDELAAVTLAGSPRDQRREFAKLVLGEEALFAPGEGHAYSNAGYAVAAAMVEAALDEPWEDALRTRLFGPLDLHARVGWPADEPEQPFGHWGTAGSYRVHDPTDYRLPPFVAPAGDLAMTPASYARFLRLHLDGLSGVDALLSARTMRELHRADAAAEDGARYACGWGVQELGGETVHAHTGSADTFFAVVVLVPARRIAVATLANAGDETAQVTCVDALKELLERE